MTARTDAIDVPPDGVADAAAVADLVAAAVLAVPGVADLHGGVFGEVATYLPRRRVRGVRLLNPGCEVHVVLEWPVPVHPTCAQIHRAVADLVQGPVLLTVEDLAEAKQVRR